MNFKKTFEDFYENNFGNIVLSPPVFYNFPVGLRFEMGDENLEDENEYIEKIERNDTDGEDSN